SKELRAMAELGLEDRRELAMGSQGPQVQRGKVSKLLARIGDGAQFLSRKQQEPCKSRIDRCPQDLLFVLEVEVNGAVSHTRSAGNIADARLKVSFFGDALDGGVQDALILVRLAKLIAWGRMNAHSVSPRPLSRLF